MKKTIVLTLLIVYLVPSPFLFAVSDIEATKVELNEINSKLNAKRRVLARIVNEERRILGKLTHVKKNLRYTQNNLRYAERRLHQNENKVSILQKQLEAEQNKLDNELDQFSKRILEIYKSQNLGYLDLFFSSATMSDFISRSYIFEKLLTKDTEIIRRMRRQREKISNTKGTMEGKVKEVRRLTQEITIEKQRIAEQVEQEKKVYQHVSAQRAAYEREVVELEKNSLEIETLLQKLTNSNKQTKLQGTGNFILPLARSKFYISSSYGSRRHPIFKIVRFHSGLDMAAQRGVEVMAADSGEVIFADVWGGYGKAIIIDHGNNTSTVYAHLSRIIVNKGQVVYKGDKIGLVGSTGRSTGPHLHFEIRKNGKTVNPIGYLPKI